MSKNRNSKKFKKRMNNRNQMRKQHSNHDMNNWFNKTFNKIFNHKKNKQLIDYMGENDEGLTTTEKLEVFKKRNDLSSEMIDNIL